MFIHETLKTLRKSRNLTQSQLANYLKIGQATIAGYESGTREPRLEILILYANFFECSLDYLVGREDDFGNILTPFQPTFTPLKLTSQEEYVLDTFRALDKDSKSQLLGYCDGLNAKNNLPIQQKTVANRNGKK